MDLVHADVAAGGQSHRPRQYSERHRATGQRQSGQRRHRQHHRLESDHHAECGHYRERARHQWSSLSGYAELGPAGQRWRRQLRAFVEFDQLHVAGQLHVLHYNKHVDRGGHAVVRQRQQQESVRPRRAHAQCDSNHLRLQQHVHEHAGGNGRRARGHGRQKPGLLVLRGQLHRQLGQSVHDESILVGVELARPLSGLLLFHQHPM